MRPSDPVNGRLAVLTWNRQAIVLHDPQVAVDAAATKARLRKRGYEIIETREPARLAPFLLGAPMVVQRLARAIMATAFEPPGG